MLPVMSNEHCWKHDKNITYHKLLSSRHQTVVEHSEIRNQLCCSMHLNICTSITNMLPINPLKCINIQIWLPSVPYHCWLGVRKSIRPVKNCDEVLAWLCVWSEVQMICIWSSWCHCHPIISCFVKIQNRIQPFWCWLAQVVMKKRLSNACLSVYN